MTCHNDLLIYIQRSVLTVYQFVLTKSGNNDCHDTIHMTQKYTEVGKKATDLNFTNTKEEYVSRQYT